MGLSELELLVKPVKAEPYGSPVPRPAFPRGEAGCHRPLAGASGWHSSSGLLFFPEAPPPGSGCKRSWTQGLDAALHTVLIVLSAVSKALSLADRRHSKMCSRKFPEHLPCARLCLGTQQKDSPKPSLHEVHTLMVGGTVGQMSSAGEKNKEEGEEC